MKTFCFPNISIFTVYINPDQSLLKPKSIWIPPFTESREFKNLIKNVSNISSYKTYKHLHKDLNDLISLTTSMKIIMKKSDKGNIITIMSPEFY